MSLYACPAVATALQPLQPTYSCHRCYSLPTAMPLQPTTAAAAWHFCYHCIVKTWHGEDELSYSQHPDPRQQTILLQARHIIINIVTTDINVNNNTNNYIPYHILL